MPDDTTTNNFYVVNQSFNSQNYSFEYPFFLVEYVPYVFAIAEMRMLPTKNFI